MMKNKIITALLLAGAAFGQDVQAMGGRTFSLVTKLGVVATPLAYYVHKKENEDWVDELIQNRNEPKALTLEEKRAFEERFSIVKKHSLFFTEMSGEDGPIEINCDSRGQVLVFVSADFLKLSEQMKMGLRAHEAGHVELMHIQQKKKEAKMKTIAPLVNGLLLLKFQKCFALTLLPSLAAYYYFPAFRSRVMEKEADLCNKTPEELYGLLMFLYNLTLRPEESWFQKLKNTHPSHKERFAYILKAFKKQTRNPGVRDIPQTAEAVASALCVYLTEKEVNQFLSADDFEKTWKALKITHTDHVKERIFFLWKEYTKRCPEKIKSLHA